LLFMANTVSTFIIDGDDQVNPIESSDVQLIQDLSRFWETELIGIAENKMGMAKEFHPKITFEWTHGRYEVTLPWKSEIRPLSNCHSLCVNRSNQLYKRLSRKGSILNEYNDVTCKQKADGIIERVPQGEENIGGCHFLPHHGVIRQDKETTKLKEVLDGSV